MPQSQARWRHRSWRDSPNWIEHALWHISHRLSSPRCWRPRTYPHAAFNWLLRICSFLWRSKISCLLVKLYLLIAAELSCFHIISNITILRRDWASLLSIDACYLYCLFTLFSRKQWVVHFDHGSSLHILVICQSSKYTSTRASILSRHSGTDSLSSKGSLHYRFESQCWFCEGEGLIWRRVEVYFEGSSACGLQKNSRQESPSRSLTYRKEVWGTAREQLVTEFQTSRAFLTITAIWIYLPKQQ